VRSIPIDAPGLSAAIKAFDNAMAYAPSRAVRPLLFYAAAAGNGHLFLPVSGIKLNEGMLLIELGRNGEHIQNLRLLPIALSRLKQEGNSEGWVLQNKLSIAGSKIATVSASGIVSIFQTGR
jgi:hypothetical protein